MYVPANTTYWNNGGLMLVQRRRRWPSMKTTLGQHHGGKPCHVSSYSHHVTLAHCSSKSAGRVDFFGDKHCSQKLRNRLLSSSESKNMIPCRYLAAILDLCKFSLSPPDGSFETFYMVFWGSLRKCFVKKKIMLQFVPNLMKIQFTLPGLYNVLPINTNHFLGAVWHGFPANMKRLSQRHRTNISSKSLENYLN